MGQFCSLQQRFFLLKIFWAGLPQCVFNSRGHKNTICHAFLAQNILDRNWGHVTLLNCGSKKYGGCQVFFFHPDWILKGWENKAQSILVQSISRVSIRPGQQQYKGFFGLAVFMRKLVISSCKKCRNQFSFVTKCHQSKCKCLGLVLLILLRLTKFS